jgi:hypothetical protein
MKNFIMTLIDWTIGLFVMGSIAFMFAYAFFYDTL